MTARASRFRSRSIAAGSPQRLAAPRRARHNSDPRTLYPEIGSEGQSNTRRQGMGRARHPMNHAPAPIVGRLAPSPTGGLHLGHARTFLLAWLAARTVGGRVVLRIEDIDAGRVRPGMAEQAVVDLRWLGLDWDE